MKRIQFIIYFTLLTIHHVHATRLVFLEGSSRSGKSSICNAIKQHTNWTSISSLYLYYCHQAFHDIEPEAFGCIKEYIAEENITHAITKNIFVFKKKLNNEQQKKIYQAVEKIQAYFNDPIFCTAHMEKFSAYALTICNNYFNQNFDVLADANWYITKKQIEDMDSTCTIVSALAYCPFNIMIDRIMYRNKLSLEDGNVMNYRFLKEPLQSFEALYDLSDQAIGSIDTLDKSLFLHYLDAISLSLSNVTKSHNISDFIMKELTQEELQKYREIFENKFKNKDTLYVVPKKNYTLVIHTHTSTPEECAQKIVTYFKNTL